MYKFKSQAMRLCFRLPYYSWIKASPITLANIKWHKEAYSILCDGKGSKYTLNNDPNLYHSSLY